MRNKNKQPRGRDALEEIETRLGGLFGALADALGEADASLSQGAKGSVDWHSGDGRVRSSALVRVRSLSNRGDTPQAAKPRRRSPSPTPKTRDEDPSDARTPFRTATARAPKIERYDEPGLWAVTVEVPGASVGTIALVDTAEGLVLAAPPHSVRLPAPIGIFAQDCGWSFANGIVEIRAPLPAANPGTPDGGS